MVNNIIDLCIKRKIRNLIFFSTIDINYYPLNKKKKLYIESKINSKKKLIKNDNFLKVAYKKLIKNKKIQLWNSDKPYDNFIHIQDVNKMIEKIINIKKRSFFELMECKSSKPIKLIKLIEFLKNKLKSKSKIEFLISIPNKKIRKIKNNINYSFLSALSAIKIFSP